jgi:hypothetical protein
VDVYSAGVTIMMLLLYRLLPGERALVIEQQRRLWEYVDELKHACRLKVQQQNDVIDCIDERDRDRLQLLCTMALEMTEWRRLDRPTVAELVQRYVIAQHPVAGIDHCVTN